jgi:hypothetical protein
MYFPVLPSRHLRRGLLSITLSLTLIGTLTATSPLLSQAKKPATNKAEQQQQKNKQPAKASALKDSKPVLDAATRQLIDETAQKLDPETRNTMNRLSDAIHTEDRAVYNDLRDEEELSMSDIGMLWQAAVERSGTIRYAIEKLSRRDATGKPVDNDSFSKRMIQNLVHLGGVAGTMWTGTPAGLIGSNMVQDLMAGNPQDSALSRVTDADMVILAKEIESLQSQLIQLYYNYRGAKERLALAQEASSTIAKYYDHASTQQGTTAETLQPLMQSMYDSAKQDEQSAQQEYNSSRTSLTMVVGPDAVAALEQQAPGTKTSTQTTGPTASSAGN